MSRSVPPSSSLPNILEGIGLEREQAAIGITEATRQHLREQGLTLGAPLGKPGAYGGVFSAEDSMRRSLAVKIVKNPQDREARKRHQRECQVLSSSEIPSDLRPYCFAAHKVRAPEMAEFARDAADGVQPYLVMSRIQGQEVHHYVSERQIPMADRIVLAERFFVALHRLHECGIVHGDISPRNVLIEKDHQVRFVDFGSARDINKAIRSMQSTLAVGGTPGYAPAAQLTGEEQASIRTDIRAAMAVSFDALTGELHQESLSVADKRQRLQAAGVPSGIIRIILKGLRESDSALTNDPKVYSSAREVVDALQAWARNRTRVRQAAVVVPMLVAACVAIVLIWWRLEAEVAERQWQTVRVLKEQIDPVARRESLPPNIRSLIDQADTEMRSVAEKQQELTPIERRQRLDVAADGLRRALDKVRQLDSMLPRMNTLGTMREKIQWQVDAWGLSKLKTDLEQEWLSLNKKLNQGEVEEARPKVDAFANRLVSAWEANERARTAALRRSELTRLLETVPGRLKETPRHKDLQGDASRADDQWNTADSITAFELTEKTYSSLQQTISNWLEKEETAEEKAGRLRDSAAQTTRLAEQLQSSQSQNSALAEEVSQLKSQITKQTELNQKDRLAREAAEKQASEQGASLTKAMAELGTTQDKLKAKETIEEQLKTAGEKLAQVTTERDQLQVEKNQWAKDSVNLRDKADRLEKLLATNPSSNASAITKLTEQEILRIESIDTKDWNATNQALTEAKKAYAELKSERRTSLKDFRETSPTIREIDANIVNQVEVIRKALKQRDQADNMIYGELEGQIRAKQAGRKELIEVIGRLPTSDPVVKLDQQIEELQSRLSQYQAGRDRAVGKSTVPSVDELVGTIRNGKQAGDVLTVSMQGLSVRFRWCPAGSFKMSSPPSEKGRDNDENKVSVTLTSGFWLMETECSQELWTAVMGSGKASEWTKGCGDKYPVYKVSYDEAQEFAKKLTKLLQESGELESGLTFRLPKEAEWEYGVRAGTTTDYCFGDDPNRLGEYAWYSANSNGSTHPVGTKKPNTWGIHDGHGSVTEWVYDYFYSKSTGGTNPHDFWKDSYRVIRGGCWSNDAAYCRSAIRNGDSPSNTRGDLGFRLALSPLDPEPFSENIDNMAPAVDADNEGSSNMASAVNADSNGSNNMAPAAVGSHNDVSLGASAAEKPSLFGSIDYLRKMVVGVSLPLYLIMVVGCLLVYCYVALTSNERWSLIDAAVCVVVFPAVLVVAFHVIALFWWILLPLLTGWFIKKWTKSTS